jgi:hypothetical protein
MMSLPPSNLFIRPVLPELASKRQTLPNSSSADEINRMCLAHRVSSLPASLRAGRTACRYTPRAVAGPRGRPGNASVLSSFESPNSYGLLISFTNKLRAPSCRGAGLAARQVEDLVRAVSVCFRWKDNSAASSAACLESDRAAGAAGRLAGLGVGTWQAGRADQIASRACSGAAPR